MLCTNVDFKYLPTSWIAIALCLAQCLYIHKKLAAASNSSKARHGLLLFGTPRPQNPGC